MGGGMSDAGSAAGVGSEGLNGPPEFTAMQLLKVMSRLANPETPYLPYFHLCRELGVRAVDGMVKGRVLDLRWTECVGGVGFGGGGPAAGGAPASHTRDSTAVNPVPVNESGIPLEPPPPIDAVEIDEDDIVPISEAEMRMGSSSSAAGGIRSGVGDMYYEEVMEVVGPKLIPTTPIMRFAMRDVVQEYEDDQSVSEYASLSDVDEY